MKLIPDTDVLADQVQQVLFHVVFILQITLSNLKFIPDVLVPCLALTEKNALFSHFYFFLPCFMYGNVFLSCTLNNVFSVAIGNILYFNFLLTKKIKSVLCFYFIGPAVQRKVSVFFQKSPEINNLLILNCLDVCND